MRISASIIHTAPRLGFVPVEVFGIIRCMKRVYVDGQNFLYKAAEVLIEHGKISSKDELTKIDIRSLVENIVGVGVEIVFYGARVQVRRDLDDSILEKTTRFSDVARRLRNTLKNQNITFNEVGKLKVRDSDVCHNCQHRDLRMQEKGVDVGIAVDIVVDSLSGRVDEVILVSSDTDLLPAIRVAKARGVKVTYIGFSDKMTRAIIARADASEVIRNQEIIDAFDVYNNMQ